MHRLPEPYETTRQELLERDRAAFKFWDPPATERDICRNKCTWWGKTFMDRYPELILVKGFFGECTEHVWFNTPEGVIIDPTRAQFSGPDAYRVFNPEVDLIYVGKCPNCGEKNYGLEKDGPKDFCSDECAESYMSYIAGEVAGLCR